MAKVEPDKDALKQALKEALTETLHEQRELLHEVVTEVVEDVGLAEAIREGRRTELAERSEVFDVLEDRT
jgi:signal transduction histidine kinase